jgi:hypothetical protein
MNCVEVCTDCLKPTGDNDITYVGYLFHRTCFIKRISKHVGELKRTEIFENHGITPEEVLSMSSKFASVGR